MERYLVGGWVRDHLLGVKSKDIDFAVASSTYDQMLADLIEEGFSIHQRYPENNTVRCGVPEGHELRRWAKDADFVLCRKDAPTGDGRRPDFVVAGTLMEDLERRDFTVNAIALTPDGELIDPQGGQADLEAGILRFVGDPMQRIREDALRVIRGFRFIITKNLMPSTSTWEALTSHETVELVRSPVVAKERIQSEMERMMRFDTLATLNLFERMPRSTRDVLFKDGLWLEPSLSKI